MPMLVRLNTSAWRWILAGVITSGLLTIVGAIVLVLLVGQRDMQGVVAQRERNDCAVAAAVMMLNNAGRSVGYDLVRARLRLSDDGVSVRDLTELLSSFGLPAASWRIEPSRIEDIVPPAILFIDDAHFVVLDSVRSGVVFVRDPVRGRLTLTGEELGKKWDGTVIQNSQTSGAP